MKSTQPTDQLFCHTRVFQLKFSYQCYDILGATAGLEKTDFYQLKRIVEQ